METYFPSFSVGIVMRLHNFSVTMSICAIVNWKLTFVHLRKVYRKKLVGLCKNERVVLREELRKGKIIGIEMEVTKIRGRQCQTSSKQNKVQNIQTRCRREGRYDWKLAVGFPVSFSRRTARIFHPLSRMFTLSWLRNARNDIFSNEAFSRKEISFAGNIDGNIFPSRRPTASAFPMVCEILSFPPLSFFLFSPCWNTTRQWRRQFNNFQKIATGLWSSRC